MRVDNGPAVRTPEAEETLDVVLGPSHDAWLAEARQLLVPAAPADRAVLGPVAGGLAISTTGSPDGSGSSAPW